jgi:protein-tyrosine phosphatase
MFSLLIRRDGLIDPPPMGEIDSHCHILPGLDDGPKDDRGALAIARLLCEMGVRQVVATPHVISDVYPTRTDRIVRAVDALRRLLDLSGLALDVVPGAEYYAEPDLLDRIARRDLLSFGEERYVLFESPVARQPMVLEDVAFSLLSAGFTPLLAHVERYEFLRRDPGAVARLREIGVRFQVNHPSFHLPKTSRRGEMARSLYIKGLVDALGTDMHRVTAHERAARTAELKSSRRPKLGR